MTTLQTHLIPPIPPAVHPTIPPHPTSLPIAPISLWPIGSIQGVHVFEGELDLEKLTYAVGKIGGVWRNVGGRFVKREKEGDGVGYFFDLVDDPIPLEIQTIQSPSPPFPTRWVIQPTLHPYLSHLPLCISPNSSSPLLTIRLTYIHHPTTAAVTSVLGLHLAHIVADGALFNRFVHQLSFFYSSPRGTELPEEEYPTFIHHVDIPTLLPTSPLLTKYKIGQLYPTFSIPDGFAKYGHADSISEPVRIRLTREEVGKIRERCMRDDGEGREWVSEQDGLSGWFVELLRGVGVEVTSVFNSVNYRKHHPNHPAFPPSLPNLSANVSQLRHTPLPSTLAGTARAIRADLNALKDDPQETLDWLASAAWYLEDACGRGEMQCMVPGRGEVVVNSNLRYDWNPRFGFPEGKTAYHTYPSILHFLRVFQANPDPDKVAKNGGGEEEWTGDGEVEMMFNVEKGRGLVEAILGKVGEDRGRGWA